MTRRDGLLKLLEEYDDLASIMLSRPCYDRQWCQKIFIYLRQKKEKLYQELIEHGCRRSADIISQDIFSEKPVMQKQTWSGGW